MNQHFYAREGISFAEMADAQREAAFGLIRASLTGRAKHPTQPVYSQGWSPTPETSSSRSATIQRIHFPIDLETLESSV